MVEIIRKRSYWVFVVLGFIWFASNLGTYFAAQKLHKRVEVVPYHQVDVIRAEHAYVDGELKWVLIANFVKIACSPISLRVAVTLNGQVGNVEWSDLDGRADDEEEGLESRAPGSQTLRIAADVPETYELIEVRVIHLCTPEDVPELERNLKVPSVFASFTGNTDFDIEQRIGPEL